MPATIDVRLPVSPDEHKRLSERAGPRRLAAYIREMLGLPPRKPGRPPKAAPDVGKVPAKRQ